MLYMIVLDVYTYVANFVPKFLWKSTQKWFGPSETPCAQTGLKSSKLLLHTKSVKYSVTHKIKL